MASRLRYHPLVQRRTAKLAGRQVTDRNTVARAFELARTGQCRSMDDLRRKLAAEGCDQVAAHLNSGALKRQLIEAMKLLD